MTSNIEFLGAFPIGSTDIMALPVKEVGPAVAFYTRVLGFELVERHENRATLRRGTATIGISENKDDPEQASCYLSVKSIEAFREEMVATGIEPSALRIDAHNGKRFRVFFAKEPYGVCFCFGEEIAP